MTSKEGVDLGECPKSGGVLVQCAGGDITGKGGDWEVPSLDH